MTERTLSGRTRRRGARSKFRFPGAPAPKARKGERDEEAFQNLAPLAWSAGMLFASVLLTAAAVFTHKPL